MRKLTFLTLFLALSFYGFSQKVTFAKNVAPIIYNNCTSCHRTGAIAPFSLSDYDEVFSKRYMIEEAIKNRSMPPWSPNPGYSHFLNEKTLTTEQIETISKWIEQGAERGDIKDEPELPVFASGTQIKDADFSKKIQAHTVASDLDEFKFFVLPSDLNQNSFIKKFELIPGNKKIVHHIFVFIDSIGEVSKQIQSGLDPLNITTGGNNYISGTKGSSMSKIQLIGGWLPGGSYTEFPGNLGIRIPKDSRYILQIHYAPGSKGQSDQTQLNIKYTTASSTRAMTMKPLLDNTVNIVGGQDIFIPANKVKTFVEKFEVNSDISLLSITPHMHLLGVRMKVYAVKHFDTKDTIKLIDDNWDFHWQDVYVFQRMIHIPAGYTIYAEGTYDNTVNNKDNPFSPPRDIEAGISTQKEMMQCFFSFTIYKKGDENISLETGLPIPLPQQKEMKLWPNPVTTGGILTIDLESQITNSNVNIYGCDGRVIKSLSLEAGKSNLNINVPESLPKGIYFVKVVNSISKPQVSRFIIQ